MREEEAWKHTRASEIAEGTKMVVIARDGGRVAGICEVKRGKGKEKHNMGFSMSVDRRYRGHGLGKALMRRAISEGKKAWKPHKIFLFYEEGNEPARLLYESLGFKEAARLRGYLYHCGKFIDRILMEYEG
jgi:ribosomal protein S18 acetylase RimI-like enzyme